MGKEINTNYKYRRPTSLLNNSGHYHSLPKDALADITSIASNKYF